MAEVALPAGVLGQMRIIAWLRWRLFLNALRSKSAKFELIAYIFAGLLFSLLFFGVGIGMGVGAYALVKQGLFTLFGLLFWGVFIFWHVFPIMAAATASRFEFRNLLRFPLRYSVFFLLSLAYGLFDPAVAIALFWLICMTIGVAAARLDLFPAMLVSVAAFFLMNLILGRALASWFERIMAKRRSREIAGLLFIVIILSVQFSGPFIEKYGKQMAPFAQKAMPFLAVFPPGLAGKIVAGASDGSASNFLLSFIGLAAYGALFAVILHSRLKAQYHGEDLGETVIAAAPVPRRRAVVAPVAETPGLSLLPGPVLAVIHKEVRYLLRNMSTLMLLVLPVFIVIFFKFTRGMSSRPGKKPPPGWLNSGEYAFPGAVAYVFLIIANLALNSFGYDSRGAQLYYVAPARFRYILLGKNLTVMALLGVEALTIGVLVSLVAAPPGLAMLLATLLWLAFAAFTYFIAGDWLSLQYPRRLEFGFRQQRASGVTALVSILMILFVMGVGAGVIAIARIRHQMWLAPLVFLILAAIAFTAYWRFLERIEPFALGRREDLLAKLYK